MRSRNPGVGRQCGVLRLLSALSGFLSSAGDQPQSTAEDADGSITIVSDQQYGEK